MPIRVGVLTMNALSRRLLVGLAGVLALATLALPGSACPFCTQELGRTMIDDYGKADLVIFGHFTNPRLGNGFEEGQTDFVIENVLKDHEYLKGKKTITLPK